MDYGIGIILGTRVLQTTYYESTTTRTALRVTYSSHSHQGQISILPRRPSASEYLRAACIVGSLERHLLCSASVLFLFCVARRVCVYNEGFAWNDGRWSALCAISTAANVRPMGVKAQPHQGKSSEDVVSDSPYLSQGWKLFDLDHIEATLVLLMTAFGI